MKKILLTGASGFVGGSALSFLKEKYNVFAPKRDELDLRNYIQVKEYLCKEYFDVVIHFASPSPVRSAEADTYETLFEDSLKIFMNFYSMRDSFGKMIYSGSGAEYDKSKDIISVSEEDIGKSLPTDSYGLSKYIINELARNSDNIYNLRIFACFGLGEYNTKFITHAIECCQQNKEITINQDCYFDYLYISDYVRFILYFIENDPKFHDYNACSGERISLSAIAEIVKKYMNNTKPIFIKNEGYNKEYTASSKRIIDETGIDDLLSIKEGIKQYISLWEENNETTCC